MSVSQKGVLNSPNRVFKYKNRMLKYTPLPIVPTRTAG